MRTLLPPIGWLPILLFAIEFGSAAPIETTLPPIPGAAFPTPVVVENLDPAAYAQAEGGKKQSLGEGALPQDRLATQTTKSLNAATAFGVSKSPGPRHLRIGFNQSVPVGSILMKGRGSLSVLKPGAPYPGDLSNDEQWLPAQRLANGQLSTAELDEEDLGIWILPLGTETRALRFTHVGKITDLDYSGKLSGVLVLTERLTNEAASAVASASVADRAKLINNQRHDGFRPWENQEKNKAPEGSEMITDANAEWIGLTWREPGTFSGLLGFDAGLGKVEVEAFTGTGTPDFKDANPAHWEKIGVFTGLQSGYPVSFYPNWMSFQREVTTRALRLRVVEAPKQNSNGGKRVWLTELMALRALGEAPLESVKADAGAEIPPPPIPVKFSLKQDSFVSLVIEKPDGFRVRNLISENWFPAGDHTVWWDGTDDVMVDNDAAMHGLYRILGKPVEPGDYVVRGVSRSVITPRYEFSVYATGTPPWNTQDSTGAWLANHSPPQAAAFVPAKQSPTGQPVIYLGCYVTEGPSGMAWVDIKDGRKLGGKKWIGGQWTAAPFLARDAGEKAVEGVIVYVGSAFEAGKKSEDGELRLTAITRAEDKPVLKYPLGPRSGKSFETEMGGIAAHNALLVASLTPKNELLFVDAREGKALGTASVENPRGVAFDSKGRLLVLSGKKLVRFDDLKNLAKLPAPQTVVASGLEDPVGLTVDDQGKIYVSDQGASHQVKVFAESGKLLKTIGNPGAPKVGPYDPLHLNKPAGLAVDSDQQIWVTEDDYLPKRVSVWSQEGKLLRAFYGPGKYGGGGALDSQDRNKFYYADEGRGAMQFRLDWDKGTYELTDVLYRRGDDEGGLLLPKRTAAPETAIYHNGRRYFTNCYNSSPTGGTLASVVFLEKDGVARPVVAMGSAQNWDIFKAEAFMARLPESIDPTSKAGKSMNVFFAWSDQNDDAQIQPEEVVFRPESAGGATVMPDLSFVMARVGTDTMQFSPISFTESGVPLYDLAQGKVLAQGVQPPGSSGGNQALTFPDGWVAVTLGMAPFSALSVSGAQNGVAKWSYPSPWPGLHASHRAPRPHQPGQLIGTTRLPGGSFEVKGSDAGPFWALHSNHGIETVFTYDGIFVANLFRDMRSGTSWRMPSAERNMSLEEVTLGEENFWPTITGTSDGKVYLVDGARSALVRLDGMDSIQRIPPSKLTVSQGDLEKSRAWRELAESARQGDAVQEVLRVVMGPTAPAVDGKVEEWKDAEWVDIDKRGVKANFNSTSKPYNFTGSLAVAGDRLYAAWKTENDKLLQNSGEMPLAPFKTGGALDLMIATDPKAAVDRPTAVAGDQRLLITVVNGKPKALLYRAVVPGTKEADKVPFSSPWRTITFDRVDDVSDQIEFAAADGNYEVSIPLSVLGLKPVPGLKVKGDLGVLRGNGTETTARSYWHNKATGIISDVPDEATLQPKLWGTLEFKQP